MKQLPRENKDEKNISILILIVIINVEHAYNKLKGSLTTPLAYNYS